MGVSSYVNKMWHLWMLVSLMMWVNGQNICPATQQNACDVCKCYTRKNQLQVDCRYLGLCGIPANIPPETHHLMLQGNALTDLGGLNNTLGLTPLNVKVLFLHNNLISNVSAAFFNVVPHVHTLMLHYNSIIDLPGNVFSTMTHLKWLWLHKNQIEALRPNVFYGLNHLLEIYLFNNSIVTIPDGLFRDQGMIKHLYLHQNNIPVTELSCCQLCGLPEPVDMKWGLIPIDQTLRCGYDADVVCTIGGVPTTCYTAPPVGKGETYVFSAAGRSWSTSIGLTYACISLLLAIFNAL